VPGARGDPAATALSMLPLTSSTNVDGKVQWKWFARGYAERMAQVVLRKSDQTRLEPHVFAHGSPRSSSRAPFFQEVPSPTLLHVKVHHVDACELRTRLYDWHGEFVLLEDLQGLTWYPSSMPQEPAETDDVGTPLRVVTVVIHLVRNRRVLSGYAIDSVTRHQRDVCRVQPAHTWLSMPPAPPNTSRLPMSLKPAPAPNLLLRRVCCSYHITNTQSPPVHICLRDLLIVHHDFESVWQVVGRFELVQLHNRQVAEMQGQLAHVEDFGYRQVVRVTQEMAAVGVERGEDGDSVGEVCEVYHCGMRA
jgi:hypothetical protein